MISSNPSEFNFFFRFFCILTKNPPSLTKSHRSSRRSAVKPIIDLTEDDDDDEDCDIDMDAIAGNSKNLSATVRSQTELSKKLNTLTIANAELVGKLADQQCELNTVLKNNEEFRNNEFEADKYGKENDEGKNKVKSRAKEKVNKTNKKKKTKKKNESGSGNGNGNGNVNVNVNDERDNYKRRRLMEKVK